MEKILSIFISDIVIYLDYSQVFNEEFSNLASITQNNYVELGLECVHLSALATSFPIQHSSQVFPSTMPPKLVNIVLNPFPMIQMYPRGFLVPPSNLTHTYGMAQVYHEIVSLPFIQVDMQVPTTLSKCACNTPFHVGHVTNSCSMWRLISRT